MYHRHITSFKVQAYLSSLKMLFYMLTKDLVAAYTCTVKMDIKKKVRKYPQPTYQCDSLQTPWFFTHSLP